MFMKRKSGEIWKWISIFEGNKRISLTGFFKVSNFGRVWCSGFFYVKKIKFTNKEGREITKIYKRTRKEGFVKPVIKQGYPFISITMNIDGRKQYHVHKLVLWTFVGPCPKGKESRHLDDNKLNNRWPENLCWGTHQQNSQDAYDNGKKEPMTGKKNGMFGSCRTGKQNPNYKHGLRCK